MKARVTRTLLVAWDGVHIEEVPEGTILDGDRAAHAVEQGFAKVDAPPEVKAIPGAPQNKRR